MQISPSELRLSAQRALLDKVTPGLRAASIEAEGSVIRWRCYFDSLDAKQREWEFLSVAGTEIVADYPAPTVIKDEFLVAPVPNKMEHLAHLVFHRCENETLYGV
jgi:hypothetical protein